MTKKELENKIMEALQDKMNRLEAFDVKMQEIADKYLKKAAIQTDNYFKKECEASARWQLNAKKHGYDFCVEWKNEIAYAMYGRAYSEYHCSKQGNKYVNGHGAYRSTELEGKEIEIVNKVFQNLVNKGYLKLSKTGKMATLKKVER